jgi:hypothetical protein
MGVQVKAWKGACWIFVNHKGQRKAKRVGTGKEGHRAAIAAAEKFQARLVLGDLSLLEESKPQEITLQAYGQQWLAADVILRLKPATVEKHTADLRKHWLLELVMLPLSGLTRSVTSSRRCCFRQGKASRTWKNNWGTRPSPSQWTRTGISSPERIKPPWIAWMMPPDATPAQPVWRGRSAW